jgi:hypothetical protein
MESYCTQAMTVMKKSKEQISAENQKMIKVECETAIKWLKSIAKHKNATSVEEINRRKEELIIKIEPVVKDIYVDSNVGSEASQSASFSNEPVVIEPVMIEPVIGATSCVDVQVDDLQFVEQGTLLLVESGGRYAVRIIGENGILSDL